MKYEILVRELREHAESGKSLITTSRLCLSASSAIEILDKLCDWYEAENKKLTKALGDSFAIDLMNKLDKAERERDAAIEELRGKCSVCKSYAPFHRRDKCLNCKWDNASPACPIECQDDNWEWHGLKDENNS